MRRARPGGRGRGLPARSRARRGRGGARSPTSGSACTAGRSPRSTGRATRPASPTTPRAPGTATRCCASRPPRPSALPPPAGAHREAAAQYARALRFADGLAPAARADLLERRSHECYVADQPLEGGRGPAARAGRATGSSATAAARAMRCARCRAILWCPGMLDEAERAGHEAVARARAARPRARAGDGLREHGRAGHEPRGRPRHRRLGRAGARARTRPRRRGDRGPRTRLDRDDGVPGARTRRARDRRAQPRARAAAEGSSTTRCARTRTWPGRPCATAPIRSPTATCARRPNTRATPSSTSGGSTSWATAPAPSSTRGAGRRRPRPRRSSISGRRASPLPVILALTVAGRLRARRGDPDPWAPLDEARSLAGRSSSASSRSPWRAPRRRGWPATANAWSPRPSTSLALARRCDARWVIGELACWRRRAGVEEDPGAESPSPTRSSSPASSSRPSARWAALGCPYEAALALAGADDETRAAARARRSCSRARRHRGGRRRRPPAARARREQPPAPARGRRRARTRRSSPPASSRSWRWSPTACATATSPSACSSSPKTVEPPRVGDPAQARRADPRRGRGPGDPPRSPRARPGPVAPPTQAARPGRRWSPDGSCPPGARAVG